MKCPDFLGDEGKRYYKRHAPELVKAGVLTVNNWERFVSLAVVWDMLRSADPKTDPKERLWFIGLLKQFQSLSKEFKLLPKAKNISEIIREGMDE